MKIFRLFLGGFISFLFVLSSSCKNETKSADSSTSTADAKADDNSIVIRPTSGNERDTVKTSLKAVAKASVSGAQFTLHYSSPAVRERSIWGALVPYDKVWVTGAHMATTLECDKEFIVGNQKIAGGKYAFFTLPGKESWTVIINKNWDQHQADEYNSAEDVVRINVQPEELPTHQERLMYEFDQTGEGRVSLRMKWEKLGISVPMEI